MNRSTALLVIFGAVAATATVTMLRIKAEDDRASARAISPARIETSEERALREAYITRYSQRKFAPLLEMIPNSVSTEKRARLSEILARREIAASELREGLVLGSAHADRAAQNEGLRKEITRELGPEIWAQVENYIQTLPQRPMLESVNQILAYRGDALSVPQMERLCTILHQRGVSMPGRRPSLQEWDAFVAKKSAAFENVAKAAAGFLSVKQCETLQQEFDVQIAMLRSQRRAICPPAESSGQTTSSHNGLDGPKTSS